MRRFRGWTVCAELTALALVACSAGETSGPVDAAVATTADGGHEGADAADQMPGVPIACGAPVADDTGVPAHDLTGKDDHCLNGPTLRQVLAFLEPSYAATYADKTPLTLSVAYTGASVTCEEQKQCVPGPGACLPTGNATLTIPVTLAFATADHEFDESLPASLTFACNGTTPIANLSLDGLLPAPMLKGNYVPHPGTTTIEFSGGISATTTSGIVDDQSSAFSAGGGTWM